LFKFGQETAILQQTSAAKDASGRDSLSDHEAGMHETTPTSDTLSSQKVNILLVDDEPANLLAVEGILADLDANLVKASSGKEALRLVQEREFAVVLLDVQMQGLDGFETAKRMRSREKSRHTPIIFLTAFETERPVIEAAYTLGAVDFLVKPLLPVILKAKVTGFVELFQKTEQIKRQAEQLRRVERREFEQRLAEENVRLRESEQQFHTLADSIPQLAWMARPDGYIFWYSLRWYEYTGKTPEQTKGWGWQSVHDPAELPRVLANWKAALAKGEPWEDTFPLRRHDGQLRWHLSRASPLRDERDRIVRWFGTNTDITDRIEMERALKEANRHKDEFLAMLAHELRNPLAPLRNALVLLKMGGGDQHKVDQARSVMERQVGHMTRIVDDLLEVSRITQGKVTLHKERLDLGRLVRVVTQDEQPAFETAGLKLAVDVPELPLWVMGDATRLTEVLQNLTQNAIKFTDRGGQVSVRALIDQDRQEAVLMVRDTGIGIEPSVLPHLFQTFAQADHSLERSKGGLGLGLALVKGLVELHGGQVQAASAGPGQGAEFTIRLPLEPEPAALSQVPAAPFRKARHLRILVVEDNRDSADSLRMVLELYGYEVNVAYTGPEGIQAAEKWIPDVVLCDIGLPGLDGYAVVSKLRQNPATAKARMIAVTGYGTEEDRRRSEQAGFDQHLIKPVDPEALQQVLASLN
jgi:PAS domain S-box-containing protein